ncbi:class I SAM-dependent methyltransferase [Natronorubrum texcoconense]|uniref:Methyltransferase domain-containing protein n=1 Tax=Natronorubrum texcoconense TaxID=1095776 RepID=A0A1G9F4N9_9EURY|nr:methyltransferase domain-containing protein [Natronorubrum texcoconense]SDK83310.1 Methyltransferase domain-containing protein [Natronorubrum texcoconense]
MSDQERQSAGWQLEQSASEAYERYLVPPLFAPWAERLLDAADPQAGDRLLDVACGTGIVARSAASRVGEHGAVVGLDTNEGMLAVAAETTDDDRRPTIEWRRGDATDLPFPEGRFDVVCCQQALQFVDEPSTALEEMHRVLAPGGRVALSVWRPLEHQPGYVVAADALERHIGDEAGTMMRSPFPAWDGEFLRTLASEAGFDDVSITIEIGTMRYPSIEEFVRREAASSPLAEPIAAAEGTVRDELIRAVEDGLDGYTDDDGVVFPMESYRLTARG